MKDITTKIEARFLELGIKVQPSEIETRLYQLINKIKVTEFIKVMGKPATYTTKEGNFIIFIKPESLQILDTATWDRWFVDAAKHSTARLAKLEGNGLDAVKAREHYSTKEAYRVMVTQR